MFLRIGVFYLLTLFFTMLLGGLQQEVGLLPELTFLPQWGPGIAGLLTMLIFRKKDGVRITFFDAGMPLGRYLWAFGLPLGLGLLAYAVALLIFGDPQGQQLNGVLLASMIAGAIGEEVGWRGYLHRRIAPQLSGLVSSLIVGVLWTPFHMHFFEGGLLFMTFYGLSLISLSVMAYAVLAEYKFNVLGATVFHLAINLTSALYAGLLLSFRLSFMIIYATIAVVIAAGVVLARREVFFSRSAAKEAAPSLT